MNAPPPSYGDRILAEIEEEFKGMKNAITEREKEKATLLERLKSLTSKLKKTKNIKGVSHSDLNVERSKKRGLIRKEINDVKDRLAEIEMEEKGSKTSSADLLQSQSEL
jgi:predicted nuclease with TOPRIM domain